MLSQKEGD